MRHSVTGAISAYGVLGTNRGHDYEIVSWRSDTGPIVCANKISVFSNKKIKIYRDKEFLQSHASINIYKALVNCHIGWPNCGAILLD